jgi:alpha-ketoglutarate-dependent 2,4-dichlorophenoxyacetate dioxygenase
MLPQEGSMTISTRTLQMRRLHPSFGVELAGLELHLPLDDGTWAHIWEAFNEHSLLVFHDQPLTDAEQMRFSQRFGPLETTVKTLGKEDRLHPNLVELANVDEDGKLMDWTDRRMLYQSGNQMWHTDSSFKQVPAQASLLSGRLVPPEGGETEFVSCRVAWDALAPEMQRRLEGKVAIHSFAYSRGLIDPRLLGPETEQAYPPVRQALVRANPLTGRKSVYIGAHASHIEGMPADEGRALLTELLDVATRPERVYRHAWRQHDLVIWDNRCLLHRGRPWDAKRHTRVMHRTTVAGEGPTA